VLAEVFQRPLPVERRHGWATIQRQPGDAMLVAADHVEHPSAVARSLTDDVDLY